MRRLVTSCIPGLAGCWVAAALAASLATGCSPPSAPESKLGRYRRVGDFEFTERSERQVASSELNGKIWVADFFFGGCSAQCETLSRRMSEIQKQTAAMSNVVLVSFTVDPRSDTPVNLRYYASRFDADTNRWLFLTGSQQKLHSLIKSSFLLPVAGGEEARAAADAGFIHSDRIALVDGTGVVRAYYESSDSKCVGQVLSGIRQLIAENNTGTKSN